MSNTNKRQEPVHVSTPIRRVLAASAAAAFFRVIKGATDRRKSKDARAAAFCEAISYILMAQHAGCQPVDFD